MAYFHWIHSTGVNSCSEEIDVVLHLLQGQSRGWTAGVHQCVGNQFARPALTRDSGLWDLFLVTGQLCGSKVLCGCYRYSSSKAWCRAMRSEWLEILQKGIACWEGGQTHGEDREGSQHKPSNLLLKPSTMFIPFFQNCENCQLRS